MKKFHNYFINHLRSYRTFHFLFFTFILFLTSVTIYTLSTTTHAEDLLEKAFAPAMTNETIINLWAGKNAVGNEILRQGVNVSNNLWIGCIVNGQHISDTDIQTQMTALGYTWTDKTIFCQQILGWDYNTSVLTTEAPLIVRIAKFLLRITMVLAVTMVIFNGIMRIIESAKWAEVKDAKKNIVLIVVGILIALMSLWIVNLISSITVSSLSTQTTGNTEGCLIDWNLLVGDALKGYICEKSFFGKWYGDRIWDRCRVNYYINTTWWNFNDGYWASITNWEILSKCTELWGEYKY